MLLVIKFIYGYFTTASLLDFLSFAVNLCTPSGATRKISSATVLPLFIILSAPPIPKVKNCSSLANFESVKNLNYDLLGSSFKPVPFISFHIANHSIGIATKQFFESRKDNLDTKDNPLTSLLYSASEEEKVVIRILESLKAVDPSNRLKRFNLQK